MSISASNSPNVYVCSGDPNSQLEGNAAYTTWADAPPDIAWDGGNFWVCTVSGDAEHAVWTMMSTTNVKSTVEANGSVATGTVTLNRAKGVVQQLACGGAITVDVSGFLSDCYSDMLLELTDGAAHAITWQANINWITPGTGVVTTTFPSETVNLQSAGIDFIKFFSPDGTTIFAHVLR